MLSGYYINMEKFLAKFLVKQNKVVPPQYECLWIVAQTLAPDVIASLSEKRCPYCGRRFKTKSSLYTHLNLTSSRLRFGRQRSYSVYTNPCYVRYQMLLDEIIDVWAEVRQTYHRISRNGKYKIDGWKVVDNYKDACVEALKVVLERRGIKAQIP